MLDTADFIPDNNYVLEVSSPGISRQFTDREFISLKGLLCLLLPEPHEGQQEWTAQLIRRDDTAIYLNQKVITIPPLVTRVQLDVDEGAARRE